MRSIHNRFFNLPILHASTALGLVMTGLYAPVQASVLTWSNAAGGAASTTTNWSPNALPGAVDDLFFNLANIYNVTWGATTMNSLTQTYKAGNVTLTTTSPHTISSFLTVGDLGTDNAVMTLTTGTLTCNALTVVGDVVGSVGRINVNDDDAFLNIGNGADLTVGNNGTAFLNITGSGEVTVADQFIAGSNSTSVSTVTISGFQIAPFGASFLDVLGTGQSRIGAGGDVSMTIDTGAAAAFAGDLVIANGSASNSSVTVHTVGLLNARLVVDGDLLIARNTSGGIAAGTGTLNVNTGGQADVGTDTFVGDPDVGSGVGTLHMGGGIFNGTGPIDVRPGALINGFGTINADINNFGDIEPSGTGLTINGILSNTTVGQIVGSKIHFGVSGGYIGSGSCLAEITGDSTSSIIAGGALSIGTMTNNGFNFVGDIDCGTNTVTLLDSNQAVLGGTTSLNGGTISCSTGIGVQLGGFVTGEGTLDGNLVCAGALDPEDPLAADLGGTLTVDGNVTMNSSSSLHIRINDIPSNGNNDRVNVNGTASFDGTVHITFPPNMQFHTGQQFILMNAMGGRTGTFASVTPTSVCTGATFVLVYSSTAAILLVRPPDCDPTHDGLVGVPDLLWVINHWGPCGEEGQPECEGDIDGISPGGQVSLGVPDLLLIINHWNQCP